MPWFKVDDSLAFHAKVVAAGNAALGLWVRAGAWCSQQLTDGHVPEHMVPALGKASEARRLVEVGLWERTDTGYRFWQWEERNPTKADVEEDRSAARDRMRRAREAKRSGEQPPNEPPNFGRSSPVVAVTPTRPDPTRNESSSNSPAPPGFDAFWTAYPRRVGKQAAQKAYGKAIKAGAPPEALLAGAQRYAHQVAGKDPEYVAHPQTWLNAGRWDDEPPPEQARPWYAERGLG